jgi:hypothetical protein
MDFGYESASSFISTMFKKTIGKPSGCYLAERLV